MNLSFSGCGFLGIYHIGVVSAFKEHAPEVLEGKIAGCSAGSLLAAAAICKCCLGQMVSDVLEIALKARSHALGPLHPSFDLVEILKNGLRRILPVDAHKICSDRLHVSITRWRDGKNFLVNQFDSREELIQALICSSFVPCYSGFIPPKFRGVYYWDGGLSNNHPILDQNTITVSPFGGESDICPRNETGAFFCTDFQGTSVQWTQENIYRISRALFPPTPEILKAMCFRGYKDAIDFLKSRNLLQCSCERFISKTSLSSVIGRDLNDLSLFDSEFENDTAYDSEEDKIIQYAHSNEPLDYKEMPNSVCEILDTACEENKGFMNYLYESNITSAISIMFLPWTLPFEFSLNFTKRVVELLPQIKVSKNPSNFLDTLLIYLNYVIQKFTYDKYQYHTRVTCQVCVSNLMISSNGQNFQHKLCHHNNNNNNNQQKFIDDNQSDVVSRFTYRSSVSNSHPKLCPRHRVPSVCSSDTGRLNIKKMRTRSYMSTSEATSTADLNEFRGSKSSLAFRRKKRCLTKSSISQENNINTASILAINNSKKNNKSKNKLCISEENSFSSNNFKHQSNKLTSVHSASGESNLEKNNSNETFNAESNTRSYKENANRVHFELNPNTDDEQEIDLNTKNASPNNSLKYFPLTLNHNSIYKTNLIDENKFKKSNIQDIIAIDGSSLEIKHDSSFKYNDNVDVSVNNRNENTSQSKINNSDCSDTGKIGWDSYWDNLESNALGNVNHFKN